MYFIQFMWILHNFMALIIRADYLDVQIKTISDTFLERCVTINSVVSVASLLGRNSTLLWLVRLHSYLTHNHWGTKFCSVISDFILLIYSVVLRTRWFYCHHIFFIYVRSLRQHLALLGFSLSFIQFCNACTTGCHYNMDQCINKL